MNRIERLKHQVLLDVEANDFQSAEEHLDSIHIYTAKAQQQLEQFREMFALESALAKKAILPEQGVSPEVFFGKFT